METSGAVVLSKLSGMLAEFRYDVIMQAVVSEPNQPVC